jgi:hypothetical protein
MTVRFDPQGSDPSKAILKIRFYAPCLTLFKNVLVQLNNS